MPIVKIGTCPCPQTVRVQFFEGARQDIMCPQTANVYQVVSGSLYKCVCSGTNPETGDDTEVHHEQSFGPYYLDNVTLD